MVAIRKSMPNALSPMAAKRPTVTAREAIVFYENENRQVCNVVHHKVKADQSLGLGRVISGEHLVKSMLTRLQANQSYGEELLPSNVLVDNDDRLIWHTSRHISTMWFRVGSNAESMRVEWPPLLFIATKRGLKKMKVFALGSNARPTPSTRLYHAPLMNIDGSGEVCQGTAVLPKRISVSSIGECEDTIVRSKFTHTNHNFTLRGGATNSEHMAFWRSKAAARSTSPERVKVSELAFSGKRLGDILKEATR